MGSPAFFKDALCRGLDPGLFYLEPGDPGISTAIAVCRECQVRMECLIYAIDSNETEFGIWGGVSPRLRRPTKSKATITKVGDEITSREAEEARKASLRKAFQLGGGAEPGAKLASERDI